MKHIGKKSALMLCTLVLSAAPVLAGGMNRNANRVVVSYGDLDVSHPAGAQVLLYRLNRAAAKVCGTVPDNRDLARRALYDSCKRAAMNAAVARVGHPQLRKIYGQPLTKFASE